MDYMYNKHRNPYIISLSVLFLVVSGINNSYALDSLQLFTPEEANKLRLTEQEWDEEILEIPRGVTPGPSIIIEKPDVIATNKGPTIITISPTDLSVLFKENGVPIDMGSLDVWAKKGIFKKSLTDLLIPYIESNHLKASDIEIPSGKFKIGFKIKDINGAETKGIYRLKVEKQDIGE